MPHEAVFLLNAHQAVLIPTKVAKLSIYGDHDQKYTLMTGDKQLNIHRNER